MKKIFVKYRKLAANAERKAAWTEVATLRAQLAWAEKEIENRRMEAAHAWSVLGGHQHRYLVLRKAAQLLLTSGAKLDPAEFQSLLATIDNSLPMLIEEEKLKSAEEYIFKWWSQRHFAG